jgi:hypothetical protein
MDKEVLKRHLTERFQASLEIALKAVDQAPDGQWIAASEWEVRDVFQKLTAECFQEMIQGRLAAQPSETQAAFSPGGSGDGRRDAGRGTQGQGAARRPRADRRR